MFDGFTLANNNKFLFLFPSKRRKIAAIKQFYAEQFIPRKNPSGKQFDSFFLLKKRNTLRNVELKLCEMNHVDSFNKHRKKVETKKVNHEKKKIRDNYHLPCFPTGFV